MHQLCNFRGPAGPKLFSGYESGSSQRQVCCERKHANNAEGMLLINPAMLVILKSRTFKFSLVKGNRWGWFVFWGDFLCLNVFFFHLTWALQRKMLSWWTGLYTLWYNQWSKIAPWEKGDTKHDRICLKPAFSASSQLSFHGSVYQQHD